MSTAWDAQPGAAHEDWDALAVGYALSALEPGEIEHFTAHVRNCTRCQRTVDETEAIGAALGSMAPAAEPSVDLRSRVLAAAEQARPATSDEYGDSGQYSRPAGVRPFAPAATALPFEPARGSDRPRSGRHAAPEPERSVSSLDEARIRRMSVRRAAPWLVSAAAAVVAAVLAVTVIGLSGSRTDARNTAEVQQRIISSITHNGPAQVVPVKNNDGSQIATVVAHTGDISVVTNAIPENNKTNSIYVLWGLTSPTDATPTALGVFDVNSKSVSAERVVNDLHGNYSSLKTFAISQEKGRTAPVLPTDVLGIGSA